MSKRGFIIIGINTDVDRMQYAEACALSIKKCDPEASICLLYDDKNSETENNLSKYTGSFDLAVSLPFGNTGHNDGFHGSNLWQVYESSPYDETIYVDYDTLFINVDIRQLWDTFSPYELAIPSNAMTYRNSQCNVKTQFEYELAVDLPKLYNSMIYFKNESATAIEWFKMADPVFQNWRETYNRIFKDKKPETFNKNILCNIVTSLLDIEKQIAVPSINNFYDLEAKSQYLWNNNVSSEWSNNLNYWFPDNNQLMIENSIIPSGIVHYRDENFLTNEILNEYRTQIDISSRRKASS